MSLTKVTYSMINGPVANVVDFGADPTGAADSYAAILAAINSNAAIIQFPAGTFKVTQTIVLGRGIVFNGAGAQDGSGGNGQSAGVASTVINYTGTGNAIEVGASYTEQVSNIHVSNLMITGNVLADGGLFIGTLTGANKCTFKNLGVFGFTNTTSNKGYGVGIRNCIESLFENVYVHGCRDGFNIGFGACTSLQFLSCYSRVNIRYGWLIRQGNGSSWYQCLAEGNLKNGILISASGTVNISHLSFYSWYSEFNQIDETGPVCAIDQNDTATVGTIYFYSPVFYDYNTYNYSTNVWDLAPISLSVFGSGSVDNVRFINADMVSVNQDFIALSGDVSAEFNSRVAGNIPPTNVSGNTYNELTGYWKVQTTNSITTYYKTGSFSPVVTTGATQAAGGAGTWQKTGRVVNFSCFFNVTAISGNITLSGLPYLEDSAFGVGAVNPIQNTVGGVSFLNSFVSSGIINLTLSGTYSGASVVCNVSGSYFAD
jgi:hypothetical protein